MISTALLVAILAMKTPPFQELGFCEPLTRDQVRFIVDQDYRVIGQKQGSGKLYSSKLKATRSGDGYLLEQRSANGIVHGIATPVACGPDHVQFLQVQYEVAPFPALYCNMMVTYDNDSTAICGPLVGRTKRDEILEAWYPDDAP
jgi:hypothetical protein